MILIGLVISGQVFAAFLILVIGIKGTERHHSLCKPHGDGLTGAFARRVHGVHVSRAQEHNQDHEDRHGQVRK